MSERAKGFWCSVGAVLVYWAALFACAGGKEMAPLPPPMLAAPAILQPSAQASAQLPPQAYLPTFGVVGKCTSLSGQGAGKLDPAQLATDPDVVVDPATGNYVMAVHWPIVLGPGNIDHSIATLASKDGLHWGTASVVLRASECAPWGDDGLETPSIQPPTADVPAWSIAGCAYAMVDGFSMATQGRYSGLWFGYSQDWSDHLQLVGGGPVLGPNHLWELPFRHSTGKLAGGIQEPAHVWLGGTTLAMLYSTNSYHSDGGPRMGLTFSWLVPPYFTVPGASWMPVAEPIAQVSKPDWISHCDLVRDPDGVGYHVFAARYRASSGANNATELWHFWTENLRDMTAVPDAPILTTQPGTEYAGVVFGPTAVCETVSGKRRWRLWFSCRADKTSGSWYVYMAEGA